MSVVIHVFDINTVTSSITYIWEKGEQNWPKYNTRVIKKIWNERNIVLWWTQHPEIMKQLQWNTRYNFFVRTLLWPGRHKKVLGFCVWLVIWKRQSCYIGCSKVLRKQQISHSDVKNTIWQRFRADVTYILKAAPENPKHTDRRTVARTENPFMLKRFEWYFKAFIVRKLKLAKRVRMCWWYIVLILIVMDAMTTVQRYLSGSCMRDNRHYHAR